jgi:hypothetical protein
LIVSDNGGTFKDLTLQLEGLKLSGSHRRTVQVLHESWGRDLTYSEQSGRWQIEPHTMCFGDINVWVIPKE